MYLFIHSWIHLVFLPFLLCVGSIVDQTGDPGQLEHVCGKPGHQLRRRPHQEPWWALSSSRNSDACVCVFLSERRVVKQLPPSRTAASTAPASGRMSALLNCEAPLKTGEGTRICPATLREGPSQFCLFVCFFLPRFLFLTFRSRAGREETPALPSTVPFQPARTIFSRKPVNERQALPDTAQISPQLLEASMWNTVRNTI